MADERLPCSRSVSMLLTKTDSVVRRLWAISFSPCQNDFISACSGSNTSRATIKGRHGRVSHDAGESVILLSYPATELSEESELRY